MNSFILRQYLHFESIVTTAVHLLFLTLSLKNKKERRKQLSLNHVLKTKKQEIMDPTGLQMILFRKELL